MPKYRVELSDGRVFAVDADGPPSAEDVLSHLGNTGSPPVPVSEPASQVGQANAGPQEWLAVGGAVGAQRASLPVIRGIAGATAKAATNPKVATGVGGLLGASVGRKLGLGSELGAIGGGFAGHAIGPAVGRMAERIQQKLAPAMGQDRDKLGRFMKATKRVPLRTVPAPFGTMEEMIRASGTASGSLRRQD